MGWERQKPCAAAQPASPSSGRWVLSGILSVITGVLLFVLHASGSLAVLNTVNIWLFTLCPVVAWLLAFCMRSYLYGRELEHFQFLQHEAAHAQQQWADWAERYLAVSASCLMLPDHISATLLAQNARGLVQQQGLVRHLDLSAQNKPAFEAAIITLLTSVAGPLLALPRELPLQVTLLTDEPEDTLHTLNNLFAYGWRDTLPEHIDPLSLTITNQLSFQTLDERLKQPEATVQLIVVIQLQGGERYSDGLAVLLFTSDDVAQKYSLPHAVRLLRPMSLEMNNLEEELALFLTTQTQACQTVSILGDHQQWADSAAELLTTGNALGSSWQAEDIQTIETYCGIQGPFSPWFVAALAADFVRIGQQPCLALSTTGAENFVYTITSGTGDELSK